MDWDWGACGSEGAVVYGVKDEKKPKSLLSRFELVKVPTFPFLTAATTCTRKS